MLAAGAGVLFALQTALMGTALRTLHTAGVLGLIDPGYAYGVVATALLGALLLQSAFEAAPLAASFPALVTTEPIAGGGG